MFKYYDLIKCTVYIIIYFIIKKCELNLLNGVLFTEHTELNF